MKAQRRGHRTRGRGLLATLSDVACGTHLSLLLAWTYSRPGLFNTTSMGRKCSLSS